MIINISNLTLWEVHSVSFVTLCKPPMMSPRVKKHIAWLLQKHVFCWISSTAIMQIVWSCRPICIREGGWVGPLVNWVLAGTRWVKCLLPSLAKPPWQGSPSQNEWHWSSMDAAAVPEKLQLRNQCWPHTHPHEQQPVYCFLSVLSPGRPSKSSFLQRKRSYSSPAQNKPICWWEFSQSVSTRVPYTLEHSTAANIQMWKPLPPLLWHLWRHICYIAAQFCVFPPSIPSIHTQCPPPLVRRECTQCTAAVSVAGRPKIVAASKAWT